MEHPLFKDVSNLLEKVDFHCQVFFLILKAMISNVFAHLKTKPPKGPKVCKIWWIRRVSQKYIHWMCIFFFYIYTFLGGTCIIIKDVYLTLALVFVCYFFWNFPRVNGRFACLKTWTGIAQRMRQAPKPWNWRFRRSQSVGFVCILCLAAMLMMMVVVVVVVSISSSSMHDHGPCFPQEQEEIENPEEAFLSFAERQKAEPTLATWELFWRTLDCTLVPQMAI